MFEDPTRFVRACLAKPDHSSGLTESFHTVDESGIRAEGFTSSSSFDDRLLASRPAGEWHISRIPEIGIARGTMVAAR